MEDPVPFITFYDEIGFAPTRQQLSTSSSAHFARRAFLYRSLGLPDTAVRESDVIEFGAGSGENAERLLSLGPASYTFVDGSAAVLRNLRTKFAATSRAPEHCELRYVLSDIMSYADNASYDLVVCEGVIPLQLHPSEMAKHVLNFSRPGGVTVFTCFDSVSGFSEVARRFVAGTHFESLEYSTTLVRELVDFFREDLAHLPGMTRRPEDWVVDSVLNPWMGEFFSLEHVFDVAGGGFGLLGMSPRLFVDSRWYKDPSTLDEGSTLRLAASSYRRTVHSLLDRRFPVEDVSNESINTTLLTLTDEIAARVKDHLGGRRTYETSEFEIDLQDLLDAATHLHLETRRSLHGLIRWAATRDIDELEPFRALWGRGQQYVSLTRLIA